MSQFSHLDADGNINMVDVGDKSVTRRSATASAQVTFPPEVYQALRDVNGQTKKGSITDTAHLAGIMAAKKTSELIPLCHQLPLDSVKLEFDYQDADFAIVIRATARVTHKTGVEMEALTAVSVAALTIYDMTKAMSHDISIDHIHLLNKTGGKSDYH
ncbi:cyclic pyranopterin monophosphate synthase MoaC [Cardiobacteriaceae bacterium TAE3-ERU3]|nr:cyclic pyranopterin monophosphate synthase MoaC [Cardiobacteriaceae bacterium TAE3-ERU3]